MYIEFNGSGYLLTEKKGALSFPVDFEENVKNADMNLINALASHALAAKDTAIKNGYVAAIKAHLTETGITESEDDARKIARYIEENVENISDDELADKFFMSKFSLIRKFKKAYGVTPMKYRENCRMEYARKLLESGDLPTRKIAEKLGYFDEIYFSRVFKKCFGITPATYRKTSMK